MKRPLTIAKTISWAILLLMIGVQTALAQTISWQDSANTDWYSDSETEFTITTAKQLAGLAKLVNEANDFAGKVVKLGQNIILNDTINWQNWAISPPPISWVPIGKMVIDASYNYFYYTFNGTFDGNGFVVSGVYINNSSYDNQGLFGYTSSEARIKNIGVVASYIKAKETVGGLVGYSQGKVSNSYFMGNVSGTSTVGGLVGYNQGLINNSYSVGTVAGTEDVGGLVGYNTYSHSINVINSYYNREASGQTDEGKGIGKLTIEMQSTQFSANLNFVAGLLSMNAWVYSVDKYPVLNQVAAKADIDTFFESGKGTEVEPYIISTKKQLEDFSGLVNSGLDFSGKYLKLGRDITLNDTINWQNWAISPPPNSWVSIGTYNPLSKNGNVFNGTFDGGGFIISGVYINDTNYYYKGLFGYVSSGGTIKNLGVTASYIKGTRQTGGLAGSNLGKINNSYFRGVVRGKDFVGGITGSNCLTVSNLVISVGTISNSYFTGTVTGEYLVGGLAGSNAGDYAIGNNIGGAINNSYSIGKVIGESSVGGLAGGNAAGIVIGSIYSGGIINNSYSVTKVVVSSGDSYGGIAAYNSSGTVSNSYYNSDSTYNSNNSIGAAKTTAQMKQKTTFSSWDFNGTWNINSKINGGFPHLRWSVPSIDWYDDSETEFIITTSQQLAGFAALVNAGHSFNGKTVKLGKDIALNDTANWQNWAANPPVNKWVPIGTAANSFNGTFDGNGYIISGVYINDTNNNYQGLFGVVYSVATVKNIGVISSYVKGKNSVGGLVGYNAGTISNSYFSGTVTGTSNIGGFAGDNISTISSSYSIGTVTGGEDIGGFVGNNSAMTSTLSNNYS
ncbi:MAG: hypothetical protein FWC26_09885, partial [Fibromonadales bacterium]|nr:hypothetical protein [Fibromonadales bacterium]